MILARASRTKIVRLRQLADLCVQRLHVNCQLGRFVVAVGSKNAGSTFQQLPAPIRDLVQVHVKLLFHLGQRLLAFTAAKATFVLKAGLSFRRVRFVIRPPVR
jgi:hypothetical protein